MKILLINTNPVVSRLLALCTRDRDLDLDEITGVDELKEYAYDLVFVDDGAYVDEVDTLLYDTNIGKKVFISYVKEEAEGFDISIQKPFLPSQIIKVIESVEVVADIDESVEKHFIFPLSSEEKTEKVIDSQENTEDILVFSDDEKLETLEDLPLEVLDSIEIEKIKALLEMDDEIPKAFENLSEYEVQLRKVEVIKEQLISEGLEILDEDEIIAALSTKTKEKALECKKNKVKYKKEKKKKQAMLNCSKEELNRIEIAIIKALSDLGPKNMKKFLKGKKVELNIKLEGNT